jgi:hypothetical protein
MRHALAMLLLLPVLAGPATAQEIGRRSTRSVLRDEKVVEITMKWTGF